MENLRKLEQSLDFVIDNGSFKTLANAQQTGNILQDVVKDFNTMAQEIKRLKQFEPKEQQSEPSSKKSVVKK